MTTLLLRGRPVGSGAPCFVIAEAGVNHNGNPDLAHRLIDVAAECGADAVKFQTFDPDALVAEDAGSAPYQRYHAAGGQLEMLRGLTLPRSTWGELASHAGERGLIFLSTAFDPDSLQVLLDLGVPALKVPSGELDNLPFIRLLADAGLPLIISTGLGTLAEVATAVEAAAACPAVALLHCVTAYPAPVDQSNLRALQTMRDTFDTPVGWSDHTIGTVSALVAVALGASILEKHLTTDRHLEGPDHAASADPSQFSAYVHGVREVEGALGDGIKEPAEVELSNRHFVRRSHHAARDLQPGDQLGPSDVQLLRPADGIPPGETTIGRRVRRPVRAGHPVTEADLQ